MVIGNWCMRNINCQRTSNISPASDNITKRHYPIDTGADVSVLPLATPTYELRPTNTLLFAANGTHIKVIGEQNVKLNLGLRRELRWPFVVADVTTPIIGADFIRHFDLLIDLGRNRIIDQQTKVGNALHTESTQRENRNQNIRHVKFILRHIGWVRRYHEAATNKIVNLPPNRNNWPTSFCTTTTTGTRQIESSARRIWTFDTCWYLPPIKQQLVQSASFGEETEPHMASVWRLSRIERNNSARPISIAISNRF